MSERTGPAVVALLCILALGVGAAALTVTPDGGGASPLGESESDDAPPDGSEDNGEAAAGERLDQLELYEAEGACLAGYDQTDLTWIALVVAVCVSALVFVRARALTAAAIAFPLTLLPLLGVLVVLFALLGCPVPGAEAEASPEAVTQANETVSAFGEALGGDGETTPIASRLPLAVFFIAVVLALLVAGLYVQRRDAATEAPPERIAGGSDRSQLASAAGDAADELELAGTDANAVYDAWARMASALAVDRPATSTPAEFAGAALDAGLDADDVSELTALFEEVRYGTAPPTAERAARAREALRRIEREHTGEPDR